MATKEFNLIKDRYEIVDNLNLGEFGRLLFKVKDLHQDEKL